MNKKFFIAVLALSQTLAFSQIGKVGINTTNPKATLEMKIADVNLSATTAEGLLIPRIGRERVNNMGSNVEQSTMVYINNLDGAATGRVANVTKVGFYHFNGTEWIGLNNQKTPYDIVLTPSGTSINIGESINLNVKSNIPAQFFYSSSDQGTLKKSANGSVQTISEFTVIGSEGNTINPNGTDYIYTPSKPGTQLLNCYFFDSDSNLISKQVPILVNGQLGEELIRVTKQIFNPNALYDMFEFKINSSGTTEYQFKIDRISGSPYPYFTDTNTYGDFVFGQWYDYLNQPIEFDLLKQTPGVNNLKITVKKKYSTIIEAEKELNSIRKLFVDFNEIIPRSKTIQLGQSVDLSMSYIPDWSSDPNPIKDDRVYIPRAAKLYTNLPIKVTGYNSNNVALTVQTVDANGTLPDNGFPGLDVFLGPPSELTGNGIAVRQSYEPLQIGTYILRFVFPISDPIEEQKLRETTVILNVTP